MTTSCDNELVVTGNEQIILQWVKHYIKDFEADCLQFNKNVEYVLITFDMDEEYQECSINYINVNNNSLTIKFLTHLEPHTSWLTNSIEQYRDLTFTLLYAQEQMDFSGEIYGENGEVNFNEENVCGVYYGCNYCQNCHDEYTYDSDEWCFNLNVCIFCKKDALKIIARYINTKKLTQLYKKNALNRLGRNAILDNYIMRKVFIKRLEMVN